MNRTRGEKPETLFGPAKERTRGVNRFTDFQDSTARDREILFPILSKLGFGADHVRREYVNEHIPVHEMERHAKFVMRVMLHGGDGKLTKIWSLKNINKGIFVQTQIIKSALTQYMKYYPTFQIPPEWAREHKGQPEALQLKLVLQTLWEFDIYFLIFTETGQYWLGKYGSLPLDQTYLTYRSEDHSQLDRLATKAGYQFGKFHSAKDRLAEDLNEAIHYTNKNERYANQQRTVIESPGNSQTRTRK